MLIIQNIGAFLSLVLGCMAVLNPSLTEKFVSVTANGSLGIAEIRATYGGFFIGISGLALFTQNSHTFVALGAGWLGAAIIRFGTVVTGTTSLKNYGGVCFEAMIGFLCLSSVFR